VYSGGGVAGGGGADSGGGGGADSGGGGADSGGGGGGALSVWLALGGDVDQPIPTLRMFAKPL